MLRSFLLFTAVLVLAAPSAWGQYTDSVLERCPTLSRLSSEGRLGQLRNPVFTDRGAARRFASDCRRVADELGRFDALPPEYADMREQAALAGEFLTGDTYLLATSDVSSVVVLRQKVKIPPPPGFVYVKKYYNQASMPPIVRLVFARMKREDAAHIEGVTVRGRYIALLQSGFHEEVQDNLAHEMVHAYLTLACKSDLPTWFQEGAAVYFSLGKEHANYSKTDDPRIIKRVTMPEDYGNNLHSFQYIEDRVGQDKLYEFVRRAVVTGYPDPKLALGLKHYVLKNKPLSPLLIAAVVAAGLLIVLLALRSVLRRDDTW